MNRRVFIAAAVVIALVHAAVLWYFFSAGKSSDEESALEPVTDGSPSTLVETEGSPSVAPSSANSPETDFSMDSTSSLGDTSGVLPRDARPFDSSRTEYGDLRTVPATKNIKGGILVDVGSRKVLWAKNSSVRRPIASLTKIMTMLAAYSMTRDPSSGVGIYSVVTVTPETMRVAPSRVDLRTGEVFTLEELMIAAAVKSANDAAFLIAQFAGKGSVDKFIKVMNDTALSLDMKNTLFFNPHGLPGGTRNTDNVSSPLDLVKLCVEFMRYPELMKWSATREAIFRSPVDPNRVRMYNHNNLLPGARTATRGVNGIKTGFTQRAGFCIAATCERDGRTLLLILLGASTQKERDLCAKALFDWGYQR